MTPAPETVPVDLDDPNARRRQKAREDRERSLREKHDTERGGVLLSAAAARADLAPLLNVPRRLPAHIKPDTVTAACVECSHVFVRASAWEGADAEQQQAWTGAGFCRDGGHGLCLTCVQGIEEQVSAYVDGFVTGISGAPHLVALPGGGEGDEDTARAAADLSVIVGGGRPLDIDESGDSMGLEDFYWAPPMGDWVDDAVCVQTDPALFQAPGGSADQKAGTEVCNTCTVRLDCLRYALENPRAACAGTWGGYNQNQLETLRKAARGSARDWVIGADGAASTSVEAEPLSA